MTIAAINPNSLPQHIVLDGISWELYENLLRELEERHFSLTYDNGVLEIMAPLQTHEKWKSLFGRMIEAMSEELDIDIDTLGSTTFRREDLAKGLEPDECYYVAHFADIQGKDKLDLTVDPPPDLAVEVDVTSRSVAREPIYAALGVSELWRFDGRRLKVRRLQPNGAYAETPASGVFPFLPMSNFEEFLLRMNRERQLTVLKEFRSWLRTLPRNVS